MSTSVLKTVAMLVVVGSLSAVAYAFTTRPVHSFGPAGLTGASAEGSCCSAAGSCASEAPSCCSQGAAKQVAKSAGCCGGQRECCTSGGCVEAGCCADGCDAECAGEACCTGGCCTSGAAAKKLAKATGCCGGQRECCASGGCVEAGCCAEGCDAECAGEACCTGGCCDK